MLIVGGVDAEAGHRRALRVAEELGLPGFGRRPSARGEARDRGDLRRAARARARGADRGHRRDRPRLPLRLLAARRAARGLPRGRSAWPATSGCPLIIHTREADDETASLLEEEGAGEAGGVIHCFTGGQELARRALALGFYISFSGIMAFPRAEVIQEVARTVPAGPAARRDRRALPGPAAPPRQAQRARVRGGGGAEGGRPARGDAWRRSGGRRRATSSGSSAAHLKTRRRST